MFLVDLGCPNVGAALGVAIRVCLRGGSRRSESGSHIPAYSAHTVSWRLPCPKVNRLLGQGRADPA
jgi:hypothetical protein